MTGAQGRSAPAALCRAPAGPPHPGWLPPCTDEGWDPQSGRKGGAAATPAPASTCSPRSALKVPGSGCATQLIPGLGHPEGSHCLSEKGGSGPSTPSPQSHHQILPFAGSLKGGEATHLCEAGGTVSKGGRTQAARCAPSEAQFCT